MIVYRLENDEGEGPYTAKNYKKGIDLQFKHTGDGKHPGWREDFKIQHFIIYVSGCPTLCSLLQWFKDHFDELKADGFKIAIYETDDWEMGKSNLQLRFVKGRRIDTLTLEA